MRQENLEFLEFACLLMNVKKSKILIGNFLDIYNIMEFFSNHQKKLSQLRFCQNTVDSFYNNSLLVKLNDLIIKN